MKKTKRVVRSITVQLYQKHSDIIDRIQEDEDISGRIRNLILEYGEKTYPETPAYAEALKMRAESKKKIEEEKLALEKMSPEDYCSGVLGGKVSADGTSCCFVLINTNIKRIPLGEIKDWNADDGFPKDHRAILDKTAVDFSGRLIDDNNWKACMEALEKA
jgi:hypothetical protein